MSVYRKVKLVYTGKATDAEEPIKGPADAVLKIRKELEKEPVEIFIALNLDGRHRVISQHEVSRGTLTASLVHPRELFRTAIWCGASAIVMAHNHPSGNPGASSEDIELTKRLVKAGYLIGINVLDHIIIGVNSHTSLKDNQPELFKEI